jgi:site-specific DNA recombinase
VSGPTLLTGICFCAGCDGAITLRTGKGGRYRYYTCSIKARQGETGCKGRSVPMEKLDNLVAEHIADRLLQPERLEEVLATVDPRPGANRRRACRRDALETSGQQSITPQMVQRFARTVRERIRIDGGGYRRDHLRALAQRVEVADCEVRIIGSKSSLLQTLTAAAGVKAATPGVRSSVLNWRMGRPSNSCPWPSEIVRKHREKTQ